MKLVLVHDYLSQMGGAEKVALEFCNIFPDSPLFTSIYNPDSVAEEFKKIDIRTTYLQKFPLIFKYFRFYFPFYPRAMESINLKDYDVILSSSSAYAKGIRKPGKACHICYCHNPARFLYQYDAYFEREKINPIIKKLLPLLLSNLKKWDQENSKQVDYFIANSQVVADRIKKIYNRESTIINPPVDTSFFVPQAKDGDYFLIVSRLNSYKKINIAIEACNELKLPLIIIGDGPDKINLEKIAGPTIKFAGQVSNEKLRDYYAACRALIFPGEEDFGIVPLEAMSCGKPVLAFKNGGALETVIGCMTGMFFEDQSKDSLMGVLSDFQHLEFDKELIREHAKKFDISIFREKIRTFVEGKYEEYNTIN
ncbi:MAG: glycosyltransferase [Elusimicrobia bacterium]|nr:glycosyltransferase [Elusimicrobiota bacterium]